MLLTAFNYLNAQDNTSTFNMTLEQAKAGDVESQCYLGFLYYHGNGVQKNVSEAVKWYKKAAEQGMEDAKEKLKILGY